MDKQLEEGKNQIEKGILLNNLKNFNQFIKSSKEESMYYTLFNENLFQSHNRWLDNVKLKIKKGIDNSEPNIIISEIDYDKEILSLIKKIAEPHNYRDVIDNNASNNTNLIEEFNNIEIFDKINELTNFNDIMGAVNSCSKSKRKSLLKTIHKKRNSNENNNLNIDKNDTEEYLEDEDIISMKEYNLSDQKEKITNDNIYPFDRNEEEIQKSLDTIVEQPSNEEFDKNTLSQKSINILSFGNNQMNSQMNKKINSQSNDNNNYNKNNYILDLNNNSNNIIINKFSPNTDNKRNYKPLKIIESITTPQKINDYSLSQNCNSNNYYISNSNNKINHNNLFRSQQKSPCFGGIASNENSSNKNNTPMSKLGNKNDNQFSFKNSNQKLINFNNDFIFSTIKKTENNISNKKNNDLSSNNNKFISPNKNNVVIIHTTKKNVSKEKSDNDDSNNKNFINIITNSINKINNQSIQNSQNNKKNHNITNNNNIIINLQKNNDNNVLNNKNINLDAIHDFNSNINTKLNQDCHVHNVVLTSTKNKKMNKNEKIKEKYQDDFEEYEMSDSSFRGNDDEDNDKFIPKWALDEEYINEQVRKQNNDHDLIIKSFGNFVVENLNLNMIFETHNDAFDIRNSTADWREDDSFAKNKITNFGDKEKEDLFPNRKLQF